MELEKRNCFLIKTLYSKEMEVRKEIESVLRLSIEDVRDEINKKNNDTHNIYKAIKSNVMGRGGDDMNA